MQPTDKHQCEKSVLCEHLSLKHHIGAGPTPAQPANRRTSCSSVLVQHTDASLQNADAAVVKTTKSRMHPREPTFHVGMSTVCPALLRRASALAIASGTNSSAPMRTGSCLQRQQSTDKFAQLSSTREPLCGRQLAAQAHHQSIRSVSMTACASVLQNSFLWGFVQSDLQLSLFKATCRQSDLQMSFSQGSCATGRYQAAFLLPTCYTQAFMCLTSTTIVHPHHHHPCNH
jgi:hypothetical protein